MRRMADGCCLSIEAKIGGIYVRRTDSRLEYGVKIRRRGSLDRTGLNVPLVADWQTIARKREQHVNENLRRANQKRRQYDYAAGEQVLKKVHNPTSLGVRTNGPYTIERVHVNGTLTIQLRQGVTERINIRRIVPYR